MNNDQLRAIANIYTESLTNPNTVEVREIGKQKKDTNFMYIDSSSYLSEDSCTSMQTDKGLNAPGRIRSRVVNMQIDHASKIARYKRYQKRRENPHKKSTKM